MKKIKSIKDLKAEKNVLAKRKTELEKAIHYDWIDVKNSLQPKNLASSIFSSAGNYDQPSANSFFSSLAAKLASDAIKKMEERIAKWLKKK